MAMRWTWQQYRAQPRWYVDGIYGRLKEQARQSAPKQPRARR